MKTKRQSGWSFVIVLTVIFLMMGTYTIVKADSEAKQSYINVTIEEGDTLWDISSQFQNETIFSQNDFIEWVEKKNGVRSDRLQPGETVVIPVEADVVQLASD